MFTILTRTANRPNFYARCMASINEQTTSMDTYRIVSRDNTHDTYMYNDPSPNIVIEMNQEAGRGHNLYFNTMRLYVQSDFPWIIHLDDDDRFTRPDALQIIADHIQHNNQLILWRVRAHDRIIPEHLGHRPMFGDITGIGFAVHAKHWINWQAVPGGDFLVIDQYYRTLEPVWIDEILTEFQSLPGGGRREDIP